MANVNPKASTTRPVRGSTRTAGSRRALRPSRPRLLTCGYPSSPHVTRALALNVANSLFFLSTYLSFCLSLLIHRSAQRWQPRSRSMSSLPMRRGTRFPRYVKLGGVPHPLPPPTPPPPPPAPPVPGPWLPPIWPSPRISTNGTTTISVAYAAAAGGKPLFRMAGAAASATLAEAFERYTALTMPHHATATGNAQVGIAAMLP